MINLKNKNVLVTGGRGFLGSHVVDLLHKREAWATSTPRSMFDLTNYDRTKELFHWCSPDYVIHCAGYNGGIEFNRREPATIFEKNTLMAINIHKACVEFGVKKIVSVMTSCAYPDTGMEVLNEEDFWNGQPNESVRAHGIAKRLLQTCAEAYTIQHGLHSVTTCITNLYGPRDTYDLVRTKVVGAIIRKVVEAKQEARKHIECWGTGKPLREFMYVEDAAEALIQSLEKYEDYGEPLNIGSSEEISIKELVDNIVEIIDYKGKTRWLTAKGDGQMKKLLDTQKMREVLDVNITPLQEGLIKTIAWYKANKELADSKK